ncbi:hypothetical protein GCM10007967_09380 [Xylanimonas ulmi]|uniref:Phosphotransferase family enzyme n=1 Tax=Xylanimonas ulmi TaxID=228973 RepID=A0A4Q7M574_9MICO|nr:phosphotransferase family enzyme [Xylanibacterium ulmi]
MRAAIEHRLGDVVVAAQSRDGGYSQGLASVLTTAGGERVFVKAVGSEHGRTQWLYREEARRAALLPAGVPAPALRWSLRVEDEADPWEAVAFDVGAGRNPVTPWRADELAAVAGLCDRLAEIAVPAATLPDYQDEAVLDFWGRLAGGDGTGLDTYDPWVAANLTRLGGLDAQVADAVRGGSLVHGDLRGDNVLLDPTVPGFAPLAVDWPSAARGAAFVNLVGMLPAVRLEGGPDPQDVLAAHPLPRGTDPDAVTAFLAGMTGYFVHSSLQPPPWGIPHVRAFQRAQAEVCVPWLRRRLGA